MHLHSYTHTHKYTHMPMHRHKYTHRNTHKIICKNANTQILTHAFRNANTYINICLDITRIELQKSYKSSRGISVAEFKDKSIQQLT